MPNLFHCHECDKPTPNKNGLCDKHQIEPIMVKIEPSDFYPNIHAKTHEELFKDTITLDELSQPEIYSRNQDKKVAEIARREKV